MKVQYVQTEHIHTVWSAVEPFIKKSCEAAGVTEYTIDHYKLRLIDGTWQLLVFVDDDGGINGAAVVYFFNTPNTRVGFVNAIAGRLIMNNDTFEQIKAYMKMNGATAIEGNVRKSVARLWSRYGFKEKYSVVRVSI